MNKTDKKSKAKGKASVKKKYSNIVAPSKMSLEEWQRALRCQQAEKEMLEVEKIRMSHGEFLVRNPKNRSQYKVVYRGEHSPWNYCSCMDFKTSGLGTCKHIEAVKSHLKGRRSDSTLPAYSSVYVDYRDERKVKIRIGTEKATSIRHIAKDYFQEDGSLKEEAHRNFGTFMEKIGQISSSFRCYPDAMDLVIRRRSTEQRTRLIDTKYTDEALDGLLKTRLYPYQREGIRFAAKAGKAIIADEMGLGKTVQAIGVAELLLRENLIQSALIVVPTSLKYQWKREIERFTGRTDILVIEGNHLKRRKCYSDSSTFKIISYNAICNDIKILGRIQTDLLIMDEVQRLKNWNTQIAKAARRIEPTYSVILSGTPLENKLEELYAIVQLSDQWVLGPYYKFRDECILTDEAGKVLGYKNLNSVGERLSGVLIRRRKKEVSLQMPGRQDKNLLVPMTKEQREMHEEYKQHVSKIVHKWRKFHYLSEEDRKKLLLFLSCMRMVCDSTFILDQESRHDTKVEECMSIVEEILENEQEKVVIFSQWERMTRLIAWELEARGIEFSYLHGGVPSPKRKNLTDDFQDKASCRVFLTTDAGSTGLNLQAAATVINLDLPWNPAVLEQRIARIWRLGQKKNIQVINLVAAQTIEESMIGKLQFKSSMFKGVLDGGEDVVFADDDRFKSIMNIVDGMVSEPERKEDQQIHEGVAARKEADTLEESDLEPIREDDAFEDDGETGPALGISPSRETSGTPSASDGEIRDHEADSANSHTDTASSDAEKRQVQETGPMDTEDSTEDATSSQHGPHMDPDELIRHGISFLGGLTSTLCSPEATRALVDRIVVKDEKSGETSIRIPVRDKDTVESVLTALGRLLSKG